MLLSLTLIYGCGKKSNPTPSAQSAITGRWYMYKISEVNYLTSGISIITDPVTDTASNYVQFNSNNTGLSPNGDFNYTISGSILTSILNGETEVDTISSLSQNNLVIHSQSQTEVTAGVSYKSNTYQYYNK